MNHPRVFRDLLRSVDVRGNLIPDACLAALAIESGSERITTDRDDARFPGPGWSHPLADGPAERAELFTFPAHVGA